MRINLIVALGSAALVLVSGSGVSMNARADSKTESGVTCQAYFGTQEGDISKAVSGAVNVSAASRWVMCGVPRDNHLNNTGTAGLWVYLNQGANDTTSCFHRSMNPDGSSAQVIAGNLAGSGWLALDSSLSVAWVRSL